LIRPSICRIIGAMLFETGKAQIDEVLRQIRNGERRSLPQPPPDPMREMLEAAHRIGSRWGRDARRKRETVEARELGLRRRDRPGRKVARS
jgi:hypothetical protein